MKNIQIEVRGRIHEASPFDHATICGIGILSKDTRTDKAVTCPNCLKIARNRERRRGK